MANKLPPSWTLPTDAPPLCSLEEVQVDTSLPQAEKLSRFLAQIRNPYCFLYHGTPVKLCFDPDGPSLEELLREHLRQLQQERL